MCDPEQPGGQRAVVVKRVKLPIGLEQRVLNDILAVQHRSGHAGKETVQAGPEVSDGLRQRELTCLEGARGVDTSRIIPIDVYVTRRV